MLQKVSLHWEVATIMLCNLNFFFQFGNQWRITVHYTKNSSIGCYEWTFVTKDNKINSVILHEKIIVIATSTML